MAEAAVSASPAPAVAGGRLPCLRLARESPGETQFCAWRDNVRALWDIAVDDRSMLHRFQAQSAVHHLGRGIVARTAASAHRLRRTPAVIARSGVDHIIVQLRLRGTQHGSTTAGNLTAGPGDVSFIDMTQPFAGMSTTYKAITMALPRALLEPLTRQPADLHGLVILGSTPLGRLLASNLIALSEEADAMSEEEAAAAVLGTASLAAACCGPALTVREGIRAALPHAILLAVRKHVETNLSDAEISAEALAARFGLSRSSLYRLFKPLGGVANYVRSRRLARAYSFLVRPEHQGAPPRVSVIARECGFESDAVFSRTFRRAYGISPREARSATAGQTLAVDTADSPGNALTRWINGLAPG